MKLLIVEDNKVLGRHVKQGMEEAGWKVDLAADGQEGLYCAESSTYEVILLDWMLPKHSGLEIVQMLRAKDINVPILMITARGAVADRVEGLNAGADDYLVKPFEFDELLARVNALYRRSLGRSTLAVTLGGLVVDLKNQLATLGGEPVELTGMEFALLAALAARSGQLIKRNELAGVLWELDGEPDSNSLDVLLARLRKKLSAADVEIATIRGKGFMLRVAEAAS